MSDHPEIYRSQAEQYEALVSREDYQDNLLQALQKITLFKNKKVVEFGAGTGRLTTLVAPLVESIQAYDISQHMLDLAAQKLAQSRSTNWRVQTADHRSIPESDQSADVILSGWSVCYIVVDHPEHWQVEIDKVLAEMDRILVPGGKIILIETLGTGFEQPTPPDHLIDYYAYLESHGFSRTWLRTDYRFENLEIARELSKFFFGKAMLEKIVSDARGITLPECTGIWSK
ncbi:MAG: class I SAM-dependent methyltransferase [Chloroflexi bacterium HGW-Chloroflexi-4]|jgi:ubiquinone/menaquinone biosynthesis C-methylase UbiE|nr:MAG: class I SAM-dependent methyltransferase [Chloroflexi bacterium HGW-Chloroflexi-4]